MPEPVLQVGDALVPRATVHDLDLDFGLGRLQLAVQLGRVLLGCAPRVDLGLGLDLLQAQLLLELEDLVLQLAVLVVAQLALALDLDGLWRPRDNHALLDGVLDHVPEVLVAGVLVAKGLGKLLLHLVHGPQDNRGHGLVSLCVLGQRRDRGRYAALLDG